MENKKTTELLDLLWKGELDSETREQDEKNDEVRAELYKRPPFDKLFGDNKWGDANDPTFENRIDELEENTKLLKRHKHDSSSGDVMVRI